MNPEMAGHAQIHSHTCYGCQALETVRAQQGSEKGVKNYVVDAGPDIMEPHPIVLAPIDEATYAEATAIPSGGGMVRAEEPGL